MNHLQKSYRPDPHAQYLLQLLALPTALVLIAAVPVICWRAGRSQRHTVKTAL